MCGSNSNDSWWADAVALVKRNREAEADAAERLADEYGQAEVTDLVTTARAVQSS